MSDIYGPNTAAVERFIEHLESMTEAQALRIDPELVNSLIDTWGDWGYTDSAAFGYDLHPATTFASLYAWKACRDFDPVTAEVARNAAAALVVQHLITPEKFAKLVSPFVAAGLGRWLGVWSDEERARALAEIMGVYPTEYLEGMLSRVMDECKGLTDRELVDWSIRYARAKKAFEDAYEGAKAAAAELGTTLGELEA